MNFAAFINVFVPSLGQLIQGRFLAFLKFFFLNTLVVLAALGLFVAGEVGGFFLCLALSIIFYCWTIVDAAKYKKKKVDMTYKGKTNKNREYEEYERKINQL